MTLTSLLSPSVGPTTAVGHDLTPAYDVDRTHWKGGGKGGWKGTKGNPNAALSALTLLAFLFFLNILQSCLKDQIGNKGMMVVMLPNGTAETTRIKRSVSNEPEPTFVQHLQSTSDYPNLSLVQAEEQIHSLVESHWSHNLPVSLCTSQECCDFTKNEDKFTNKVD